MRRRDLLSLAGMGLATALAGCTGSDDGDDATPTADGDGMPSDGDGTPSSDDTETGDDSDGPGSDDSGSAQTTLAVGESFTNPLGNTLTVDQIELTDSLQVQSRFTDAMRPKEAPEGEQWAVVTLAVTNDSGQTQYLTPTMEIQLRANGTEHRNTAINWDEGDGYSPAEVQDGGSRRGMIAYGVSADLSVDDLTVVHSNDADGESWTATWSTA